MAGTTQTEKRTITIRIKQPKQALEEFAQALHEAKKGKRITPKKYMTFESIDRLRSFLTKKLIWQFSWRKRVNGNSLQKQWLKQKVNLLKFPHFFKTGFYFEASPFALM